MTAEADGTVAEIHLKVGDQVSGGEVAMILDTTFGSDVVRGDDLQGDAATDNAANDNAIAVGETDALVAAIRKAAAATADIPDGAGGVLWGGGAGGGIRRGWCCW